MRTLLGCLVACTVGLFAACGGTSSALLDSEDAGSIGDAGHKKDGSTKSDGGCVNPVLGATCTTSESVCGQVGSGNPCCDEAWRCIDGKWQSLAADCACTVSETCGTKTCAPGQYCQVQPPGIALEDGGTPPTDYECFDPPSNCAGGVVTCACLEAADPCYIDSCSTSSGEVQTLVTLYCIGE